MLKRILKSDVEGLRSSSANENATYMQGSNATLEMLPNSQGPFLSIVGGLVSTIKLFLATNLAILLFLSLDY
jgi:hypothetical protein